MDKSCVNLIKLSVGTENVDDLAAWQSTKRAQAPDGLPRHVTRMWPKREAEILDGGSIYWVIKGVVQCRQKIMRLDEYIGSDGIRRCAIVLDPALIRTQSSLKRPFQGWRYLPVADWRGRKAWQEAQGIKHGFEVVGVHAQGGMQTVTTHDGRHFTIDATQFTGLLRVIQPAPFNDCLLNGIGKVGKAFGLNLLVVH